jgi:hypothetical protein
MFFYVVELACRAEAVASTASAPRATGSEERGSTAAVLPLHFVCSYHVYPILKRLVLLLLLHCVAAGRIMNHLVMVMGSPSEEQRRMLESTTEQWNRQQRWNV